MKAVLIQNIGTVLPSDAAFEAVVLQSNDLASNSRSDLFGIKNSRRSQSSDEGLQITYTHHVTYRGDPIYVIKTTTTCNGKKIWGQSSCCVICNGDLKVKISNKAKDAKFNNLGTNSREGMTFSLLELLVLSAKFRESEMEEGVKNNGASTSCNC